jgi:L-glyceraldehyde 3-phosphate reductase
VEANLPKVEKLNELAQARGQSLAQMAIAWTLRKPAVTSSLIGASSVKQLEDSLTALNNLQFSDDELNQIESILQS